jgi:hypothetical protein
VHPGYVLGRDYEGMDDVLLVAVTERRTPADVDRLADVLVEVCRERGRSGVARLAARVRAVSSGTPRRRRSQLRPAAP